MTKQPSQSAREFAEEFLSPFPKGWASVRQLAQRVQARDEQVRREALLRITGELVAQALGTLYESPPHWLSGQAFEAWAATIRDLAERNE